MQGMEGMSSPEMTDMMEAMDCCHTDDGGLADPGKPCPSGTSCQSIGPALLHVFPVTVSVSVAQPTPPLLTPRFQSHDPPLLWRPPALI